MTDIHQSVSRLLLEAGLSETSAGWLADQIIKECFRWRPIDTAPRDALIDVWLEGDRADIEFYCAKAMRLSGDVWGGRSPNWRWEGDRFRPATGLHVTTFIQPTRWMPIPPPPPDEP